MPIVVLKLPDVKVEAQSRARQCPSCKGEILQRWGGQVREIRDPQVKEVLVYRYHCCGCGHTFRHYPEGVGQAQQSLRMQKLAAICWALGLSTRSIGSVFAAFGVSIGRMTVWRDVQKEAERLKRKRIWEPVRVMGLDGAYVRGWGKKQPVLVAVDLGDGQPVTIGYINEKDPRAVRRWLEPLVKRLGVSVIVTDDLVAYRIVAEQLGLEHQVCQFHVRRWVGRALRELKENLAEEFHEVLAVVQQLIDELPPEGGQRLYELWKHIPVEKSARDEPLTPTERLRNLLIRLSEHWASYRVFDWQPEVPWTNNQTEQVIGRMKMRSRTVRGYKTKQGLLNGLMLSGAGVC
jgi:transposase-like protein